MTNKKREKKEKEIEKEKEKDLNGKVKKDPIPPQGIH